MAEQAYFSARIAAGLNLPGDDAAAAIERGYTYCEELPDGGPNQLVIHLVGDYFFRDDQAIEHLCPQHLPQLQAARAAKGDGRWVVTSAPGERNIPPGEWRILLGEGATGVTNCYWERVDAGGQILDNDFITFAPGGVTVSIRSTDAGFVSEDCGVWLQVTT